MNDNMAIMQTQEPNEGRNYHGFDSLRQYWLSTHFQNCNLYSILISPQKRYQKCSIQSADAKHNEISKN
jgi:hypothetical protein